VRRRRVHRSPARNNPAKAGAAERVDARAVLFTDIPPGTPQYLPRLQVIQVRLVDALLHAIAVIQQQRGQLLPGAVVFDVVGE